VGPLQPAELDASCSEAAVQGLEEAVGAMSDFDKGFEEYLDEIERRIDRAEINYTAEEARVYSVIESLTNEQLEFFVFAMQSDTKAIWQLSGVLAAERHRRKMQVPDG
jgi:hypothetical protein